LITAFLPPFQRHLSVRKFCQRVSVRLISLSMVLD
jgi:hypothetical protein